eukprot:GHUV01049156.1.p1 GENE.GHUV01049156.1~~GHUV01049156.1.p1  ORF type:complete len:169 (-),score=24.58 GHUV01049156.1:469-975(-)
MAWPLNCTSLLLPLPGTHDILRPYDSDGMASQLYFTAAAPVSRFWQSWDLDLVFDVLQTPLTRESHSSGVSLTDFYRNQKLKELLNPLTLSLDKEGKVCVQWGSDSASSLCIRPTIYSTPFLHASSWMPACPPASCRPSKCMQQLYHCADAQLLPRCFILLSVRRQWI